MNPSRLSSPSLTLNDGREVPLRVKKVAGKRMRLRVAPEGVLLTLPPRVSARAAHEFLMQSMGWIESQMAAVPEACRPPYTASDSWEVPLAGCVVPVVWGEAKVGRVEIVGDDDEIHAWASPNASDAHRRALIADALNARLRADVAMLLAQWLPTIAGGHVSRVVLAPTQSQWGSMSSKGRLSLSTSLVGARPSALEYVVIHELCHQLHMDHSPAFWAQVRRRCPHYKAEEAHLNRVGMRLHALMARLR